MRSDSHNKLLRRRLRRRDGGGRERPRANHDVFGCRILEFTRTKKKDVENEIRKRCLRRCIETEQNVRERRVLESTNPKRLSFPLLHHDGDAHALVRVNLRLSLLRITNSHIPPVAHLERSSKSAGIVGFAPSAVSFFVPRLPPLSSFLLSEARGCFLVRLIATSSSSSPVFTSFIYNHIMRHHATVFSITCPFGVEHTTHCFADAGFEKVHAGHTHCFSFRVTAITAGGFTVDVACVSACVCSISRARFAAKTSGLNCAGLQVTKRPFSLQFPLEDRLTLPITASKRPLAADARKRRYKC